MPNIKSAKKRVLVTESKTLVNKNNRNEVKTAIKKLNAAIDAAGQQVRLSVLLSRSSSAPRASLASAVRCS